MELANVDNVARDDERNITFNVKAYRKLSDAEILQAIRVFRSTKQGRKLKANSTYTIISIIGARD